jgi:hypothetical protein
VKRHELEHIIRAAGDIADDEEIIVLGSQSILGSFPDAPEALTFSMEADVYPKNKPERWNLIDGCIGEHSPFHETYNYYAQGVGEETAILPEGWKQRLVPIRNRNTRDVTGWCLEVHDLAIAKWIAGREKDLDFNRLLAREGMIEKKTALERLTVTNLDESQRKRIAARIERSFANDTEE